MRILVAPLNWGLGHASRCVPLIERLLAEGNEVVLGGDGESLTLLRKHFPTLHTLQLASLNLQYSKGKRQVWAMICSLPKIIHSARIDHLLLADYLRYELIDEVISDNRFGLYISRKSKQLRNVKTVYMTHQLVIPLPQPWKWLESAVAAWHRIIIKKYDVCWIPDEEVNQNGGKGLAGRLSHPKILPQNAQYIGVLSRFAEKSYVADKTYKIVIVLSGLEPQRTMLEQVLYKRFENSGETVLIVRSKFGVPPTVVKHGKITIVPWLDDEHLASYLLGAERIICRSGYSSIMDMYALRVINKVEWHPTPGQPEQEYLNENLKNTSV